MHSSPISFRIFHGPSVVWLRIVSKSNSWMQSCPLGLYLNSADSAMAGRRKHSSFKSMLASKTLRIGSEINNRASAGSWRTATFTWAGRLPRQIGIVATYCVVVMPPTPLNWKDLCSYRTLIPFGRVSSICLRTFAPTADLWHPVSTTHMSIRQLASKLSWETKACLLGEYRLGLAAWHMTCVPEQGSRGWVAWWLELHWSCFETLLQT